MHLRLLAASNVVAGEFSRITASGHFGSPFEAMSGAKACLNVWLVGKHPEAASATDVACGHRGSKLMAFCNTDVETPSLQAVQSDTRLVSKL